MNIEIKVVIMDKRSFEREDVFVYESDDFPFSEYEAMILSDTVLGNDVGKGLIGDLINNASEKLYKIEKLSGRWEDHLLFRITRLDQEFPKTTARSEMDTLAKALYRTRDALGYIAGNIHEAMNNNQLTRSMNEAIGGGLPDLAYGLLNVLSSMILTLAMHLLVAYFIGDSIDKDFSSYKEPMYAVEFFIEK